MQEIWKDIKGYKGYYQISNLGRVKSLSRVVPSKNGVLHFIPGQIMKFTLDRGGYSRIVLTKNNHKHTYRVNQLVAKTFIPNPYHHFQVNHINENRQDNRVCNLEWCSAWYNIHYGHCEHHPRREPIAFVDFKTHQHILFSSKYKATKWLRNIYRIHHKRISLYHARRIINRYANQNSLNIYGLSILI